MQGIMQHDTSIVDTEQFFGQGYCNSVPVKTGGGTTCDLKQLYKNSRLSPSLETARWYHQEIVKTHMHKRHCDGEWKGFDGSVKVNCTIF